MRYYTISGSSTADSHEFLLTQKPIPSSAPCSIPSLNCHSLTWLLFQFQRNTKTKEGREEKLSSKLH